MAVKEQVRIGGRSARIQAAVHAAVRELTAEADRGELTVPVIAARAGVTPRPSIAAGAISPSFG